MGLRTHPRGSALIKFDEINEEQWIRKEDFKNLNFVKQLEHEKGQKLALEKSSPDAKALPQEASRGKNRAAPNDRYWKVTGSAKTSGPTAGLIVRLGADLDSKAQPESLAIGA